MTSSAGKVRSLELLDDTMDFNELYSWLDKFELFDHNFRPKVRPVFSCM